MTQSSRDNAKPESRASAREHLSRDVAVSVLDDNVYYGVTTDLSAHGVGLMIDGSLPDDGLVRIQIGDRAAETARIVWSRGSFAGAQFDAPLDGAVLRALAGR